MKIAEDEKMYKLKEVDEILGYTRRWVYELIDSGKLEAIKFGSSWRVKGEWINDFIERSSKQ